MKYGLFSKPVCLTLIIAEWVKESQKKGLHYEEKALSKLNWKEFEDINYWLNFEFLNFYIQSHKFYQNMTNFLNFFFRTLNIAVCNQR